ncbi:Putative diguanylate cyclase (GGDEF domain) [Thiobacillus denitrificans ATCC 25259]|uniref:diguanylate cyclase n=1 Tax=Thiobacillus denitrificans (strain ATCC 25259 / T1) TaxID=292415 RepID=Q3SFG4_THIDA|nr:diguanylate cyclase [Thiobacillus denitrificans]AAZ98646.1 Putative diguanylate cyclase (GGDEF domain) [Thiobacillus denitrificans ATCC 25259]
MLNLVLRVLGALACVWAAHAAGAPLSTAVEHPAAVGRATTFLQEQQGRLEWRAALAAARAGRFAPGSSPVLNFGIGAAPAWIHFTVDNPSKAVAQRRLSIETAWLDRIEVFVVQQGRLVAHRLAGDRLPYAAREVVGRYFVFDTVFAPGASDVLIRIETPDPMVIPLYLQSSEAAAARQTRQELSYGAVYGFLFALLVYNAILYASLGGARYISYAFYLAMFMLMNIAYTGHGYAWLWPESTVWQQWSNPVLMYLYGAAGLLFAVRFLDLGVFFPRVRRAVFVYSAAFGTALVAAVAAGRQVAALWVSFSFVFLFTGLMLALGLIAVRAGQKPARYFLIAALAAMVGAALTTLSTWGFVPHNAWTFRAVEVGMLFDATLLALALAYQFRVGQEQQLRAEQLAQLDPLTGLNNRRAFYGMTAAAWSNALRHAHATSVLLLDIDHFKQINDRYGHAEGDAVLKTVAGALKQSVRQGDVLARWGGEEFIVFLPETGLRDAALLAERLRVSIAALSVTGRVGTMAVTASIGVAERADHATLDSLIAAADACLFASKQQGRNRVTSGGQTRVAAA